MSTDTMVGLEQSRSVNRLLQNDTHLNKLKPTYIVKLRLDEDGRVVARCLNLQGVVTDGANENEALKNVIEAIDGILEGHNMDKMVNL